MPIFTLRAFADASELSGFKCGIDVMDNFIRDGLTEELQSTGCDSYLLLDGDEIVAFFATCHDTLVLEKPIPKNQQSKSRFPCVKADSVPHRTKFRNA